MPNFPYPIAALLISLGAASADLVPPEEFDVPEGLEVTVWATTPMFYNPTNFDVDERGRIWVTEGVNYRKQKMIDGGTDSQAFRGLVKRIIGKAPAKTDPLSSLSPSERRY